jgi:imidazolonepropionase-like amidohydrolase
VRTLAVLILAALFRQGAPVDEESVALTHLRIITVTKGTIESGTIVIKGGKIAAIGADVTPPAGARVVEARGLVAFPGLVHPYSRLGLADLPGSTGSAPQHLAVDELNPSSEAFGTAARSGVTTLVLQPAGSGISGQAAAMKPTGWTREEQVIERSVALRILLQPGTAGKDALRQSLEAGKKAVEGEKKSPPAKPDEKAAVLSKVLKGELPVLVEVPGPAELLHFWQVLESFSEFKPRVVFAASPDVYKAAAELGARKAWVVLRPLVAFAPYTRERINTAAELVKAGAEVAFAPMSDAPEALQGWLFRVAELVKYGLPRDAALRAVTIVPAQIAGIEKRVGSLEAGKDADLLLFSGDPLSPQSRLREVYINGVPVHRGE